MIKKGFSGFAFFLLGASGVFPALPQIDAEQFTLAEDTAPKQDIVSSGYQAELCRWQKDFTFFSDLSGEKKLTEKEAPCREVATVPSPVPVASETPRKNEELDNLIREVASGYPLEVMAPAIASYDRSVAALIVGIAKKESDWGKHAPRTADGADCFNYWGFKGAGSRGVAMGHGCFGSPEEAVHAVGDRITELVDIKQTSEPKNMTIWKCGSSCATHSPESVRKWVSDVDLYYRKIAKK